MMDLILKGIPDSLRAELWLFSSGAINDVRPSQPPDSVSSSLLEDLQTCDRSMTPMCMFLFYLLGAVL